MIFLQSGAAFGADAQVHASVARRLPEHGFEVAVACNTGPPQGTSASAAVFSAIPHVRLRPTTFGPEVADRRPRALARTVLIGGFGAIVSAIRLSADVRRRNIDIVHCTEKARETIFAYVVARVTGARLVVHLHVKADPWFSAPTKWVMHRADRLIAISQFVATSAIEMGYDPARVAVALNGMAPQDELASLHRSDRESVRDELGVPATTFVVSIVARLNGFKGHRQLFEAMAIVIGARQDIVLLVIGADGTAGIDGPVALELRQLADELGIATAVRFLGFRSDAHRLIHASDVFAMPSPGEPFGLVFIEAMAAGIPVVGIADGGTVEVVDHGVTGLLSPYLDIDALACNVQLLLDDAGLRERMGAAGRRRVETEFTADRMTADIAAIYRSL
ncbi:MAG: putative glycosyl transferase [Ilumatobacteraceae bacterium]|nr:putative glycosyl transferase [Ilumatobacteraceae bacterium]